MSVWSFLEACFFLLLPVFLRLDRVVEVVVGVGGWVGQGASGEDE